MNGISKNRFKRIFPQNLEGFFREQNYFRERDKPSRFIEQLNKKIK